MDLNVTFAWVEGFNVAGFPHPNTDTASAWAVWPYHIWDDPWIEYDQVAPDKVKAGATVNVFLFPEFSSVFYPISLWIEFQPPNQIAYGAEHFHRWWLD
jgi:hypothetical protein